MGMAAGWLVIAGCTAVSVLYFGEIKELARTALGMPPAPQVAAERTGHNFPRAGSATAVGRGRVVELKAGSLGHYHTRAEINGRSVEVMVDTGASMVALTADDARRAGVFVRDSEFTQVVQTANGVARFAPVMLERVSIGDITVRNVAAAVSEPGKLRTTLLGMSFLGRLQRIDMHAGVLVLQE
jgi:aspartyl protease family protein